MEFHAGEMPDTMGKHDPLGDLITIALVLVTLFGALVAWKQANAHFEHDEATVRAEEWTVLASSERTRASQAEQLQLGRRRLTRRDSMNAKEALGRAIFGHGNPTLLTLEARHWRERAGRMALGSRRLARESATQMREIEAGDHAAFPYVHLRPGADAPCSARPEPKSIGASAAEMGPSRGPPSSGYATKLQREAFRMEGRRAAAAETAARAEEQFTHYAASLALIAVALFFFGYTLTKYGFRFRRLFALAALLLTLLAAFLAVKAYREAPPKPDPAAAAAYADGQIALGSSHFQTALEDFRCATHLNPHFAEAFLQLSRAFDERGTPRDVAVINESLESRSNLREALKYGRRARQLNPEDPQPLNQISTALFVDGVTEHNHRQLARALALDRQQGTAMPKDPIPAFNAATTLLALGRPWPESYRQAESLMGETSQPLGYAGGALTDLDFLRTSRLRDGLAAATREAKEQVVAAAMTDVLGSPESGPPAGRRVVSAGAIRLKMTPAAAYLEFSAGEFRVDRDQLFVAVYRHERLGWQEIQPLSGPVVPTPVHDGYQAVLWSYSPTSCLAGGRYRVELYVNGRLANVGPVAGATVRLPHLTRRRLPGLNLYLCDPGRSWRRIPRRAAGLVEGFERRVSTGREGIVVFDVSASPPRNPRGAFPTLLRRFSPPLPRGAETVGPLRGPALIGNLSNAKMTGYVYANGAMILATATTPIGRRLIIAAFGPPTLFAQRNGSTPSLGQSLLESLITYDSALSPG